MFEDDDWRRRDRRMDLSRAPTWVKVCVWVGSLVALVGFGIFALDIISAMTARFDAPPRLGQSAGNTSHLGLGFGVAFAGGVLVTIGALGNSTSRRR